MVATRSNDDPEFIAANIRDGVNILGVTGTYPGCTAPSSCPNVGDVCTDGSLFAGFMLYNNSSCEALYVTDTYPAGGTLPWKTTMGTNDISTVDHIDGKVNHANRGGLIADFPAFDECESNTFHSKSDWYLPARAELNLLWLNRAAINANATDDLTTNFHWTSSQYNTNQGLGQPLNLNDGRQYANNKTSYYYVRCFRRD